MEEKRSLESERVVLVAESDNAKATSEVAYSIANSRRSTSSTSSYRARAAAARRASLMAEASAQSAQHKLEEDEMEQRRRHEKEEMEIRQRRQTLQLEIEIAKAAAEEEVWAQAEIEEGMMNAQASVALLSKNGSLDRENNQTAHPEDNGPDLRGISTSQWSLGELSRNNGTVSDINNALFTSEKHANIVSWAENVEVGTPPEDRDIHGQAQSSELNPLAREWVAKQDNSPVVGSGCGNERTPNEEFMRTMFRDRLQQQKILDMMQLPKAELMTFDGNPLKYWVFMQAFKNTVEKDTIDSGSKLLRLHQYCSGKAKNVIQCCLAMEPNQGYTKAWQLLKQRFGNSYIIAEAWIRKVTQGPSMRPNDKDGLQDFSDDLQNCQETLHATGHLHEINCQSTLVKIITRLPAYLQNRWKKEAMRIRRRHGRSPNIGDIAQFVQDSAEEANDPVYGVLAEPQKIVERSQAGNRQGKGSTYSASISNGHQPQINSARVCLKCRGNHTLFGCEDFKTMKPEQRLTFAQEHKLCFNCLNPGHMVNRCGLHRTCSVPGCGRKHTKFLHLIEETSPRKREDTRTTQGNNGFVGGESENFSLTGAGGQRRVVLPIVPVIVRAPGSQREIKTYALLDSGSTHSFCSSELADRLKLAGKPHILSLTTLEKADCETRVSIVSLEVQEPEGQNVVELPSVFTRPVLPIDLDNMAKPEDIQRWRHLRDISLPQVDTKKVMLLIGQDYPEALLPREIRKGEKGEPYATRTLLGWTLNGPLGGTSRSKASVNYAQTDRLDLQLEKFWKIEGEESLVDNKLAPSYNDKRAISIWEESLVQCDDGHYEARIPFKTRPPSLPYNRYMAEQRLRTLQRKLNRSPDLHSSYTKFMEELVDKGYAKIVDETRDEEKRGRIWFLPHHSVFNPKKPDKVRIVFDCAAEYQGTSLNDQVLQGPDLTNSLVGVLLRFRQEPVAIMADIEAMFHQVRVTPEDRDALRFLWWPGGDLQQEPVVYSMTVHLFGGTWSPSCCNFVLRHTARANQPGCDKGVTETILKNFYVDDCLKSIPDVESAIRQTDQLRRLLATGGFNLTKWISNNRNVLSCIPEEERAKEVKGLDLNHDALPVERALGVYWDIDSDSFCFKINIKDKPLTRRGLLSVVSSVYDPLGFAGPYTLKAKMIIQDLSRLKLGWDEQLPDKELDRWQIWKNDLTKMENLRVPRCVKPSAMEKIAEICLHYFSDASQSAYGVTAYLRVVDTEGNIQCSLLLAKSRLAPIKSVTIPRLELTAATLSIRLDNVIRRELELPLGESVFWTDSTTVLRYINNDNKRYQTFVANRVATIRDGSLPKQWRYVDTNSNPADEASRGLSADELLSDHRWLHGPSFLMKDEAEWPKMPASGLKMSDDDPEVKKVQICLVQKGREVSVLDRLIDRHSSWHSLKKNVAWILRARKWLLIKVKNEPEEMSKDPLTVEEIENASLEIIKYVQKQSFLDEMKSLNGLKGDKPVESQVPKTSAIYRLAPTMSEKGVLVVGGRLKNAPILEEAKHQMILPKKHHVVELIIKQSHEMSGHSGREYVLADTRQRYWIINGRTTIRRVLNSCFKCRRHTAPLCDQRIAELPQSRVTPGEPPFTYVGVDIFGIFYVKHKRSLEKRYGCIFTCFALRAIHIEVTHSLDTTSFINALQRFISRRGQPKEITSDNGGNFVGAERELREDIKGWNQRKIHDFLLQKHVKWRFNPPAASHMGGVWERQIRTVRKVLRALMKEQTVDDETLSTLMCLVEGIVNGRPITTVSEDPNDYEALTPNHMLLLRAGPALPPGEFQRSDMYSRRRWRQVQYLADVFWRRWTKEYLPTLQESKKWTQSKENLRVGDMVLVSDENNPRNLWPLARVVETFPGKDGKVRTVKVKTRSSEMVRPIHKLCLLESVHRNEVR